MVLQLFVGLLHLIFGICWFLLGLIRRLVAGAEWGFGEPGPLRRRTALSFRARFFDERPGNIGDLATPAPCD
jgi:hypothetical protein